MIAIGEGKVAVDQMRRQVNDARAAAPSRLALLRQLAQYARILEMTEAYAEADFIWNEALDVIAADGIVGRDAAEALLAHGLLLIKMRNYDGAVTKLKEAVHLSEELDGTAEIDRMIILAKAWRGQSEAYEALGELTQASNALDTLMNVKRQIRFIAFSPTRGR